MTKWLKKARKKPPSEGQADRLKSREGQVPNSKSSVWPGQERRRDSRVREEDKVVIELLTDGQPPSERTVIHALTQDISPGGVRLTTHVFLPVNTHLKLEIVLSRRRRVINVVGVVRWCGTSALADELFETGIEFTQISPDDKMLLLEHTYRKRK